MDKRDLLKRVANSGYNIGFGAKKNFATYDIVENIPKTISFISMAFGIYCLAIDGISSKKASATLIVFGIISIYISFYNEKKLAYRDVGIKSTELFNKTHNLYLEIKNDNSPDIGLYIEKLNEIESNFYEISMSKQILFSGWYAHYKFFWEMQIKWVSDELKFSLLRDKIPLSLYFSLFFVIIFCLYAIFNKIVSMIILFHC